jgi:hypothetical protein
MAAVSVILRQLAAGRACSSSSQKLRPVTATLALITLPLRTVKTVYL